MIFLFEFKKISTNCRAFCFLVAPHMGPIWDVISFWKNMSFVTTIHMPRYRQNIISIHMKFIKCIVKILPIHIWMIWNIFNGPVNSWVSVVWFAHDPYGSHMGRTQKYWLIWKTCDIFKNMKVLFSENEFWVLLSLLDSQTKYGKKYPSQF